MKLFSFDFAGFFPVLSSEVSMKLMHIVKFCTIWSTAALPTKCYTNASVGSSVQDKRWCKRQVSILSIIFISSSCERITPNDHSSRQQNVKVQGYHHFNCANKICYCKKIRPWDVQTYCRGSHTCVLNYEYIKRMKATYWDSFFKLSHGFTSDIFSHLNKEDDWDSEHWDAGCGRWPMLQSPHVPCGQWLDNSSPVKWDSLHRHVTQVHRLWTCSTTTTTSS